MEENCFENWNLDQKGEGFLVKFEKRGVSAVVISSNWVPNSLAYHQVIIMDDTLLTESIFVQQVVACVQWVKR